MFNVLWNILLGIVGGIISSVIVSRVFFIKESTNSKQNLLTV